MDTDQLPSPPPSPVPVAPDRLSSTRANPTRPEPVFPHERLRIQTWNDPVLDVLGHDPRSPYVEQFWLAVLGPSCLFLLRRLAAALERRPDGFEIESKRWAAELGLGMKGGKHGPFWRSVERACRFNTAQRNGDLLVVRRRLPPLSGRQVSRLPDHLGPAHRVWAEAQHRRPKQKTLSVWTGNLDPTAAKRPPSAQGDEPATAAPGPQRGAVL